MTKFLLKLGLSNRKVPAGHCVEGPLQSKCTYLIYLELHAGIPDLKVLTLGRCHSFQLIFVPCAIMIMSFTRWKQMHILNPHKNPNDSCMYSMWYLLRREEKQMKWSFCSTSREDVAIIIKKSSSYKSQGLAQCVLSQLNTAYYFSKHFCWQLATSGNRSTCLQRSKEQPGNLFIHSRKSFS